MTISNSSGPTGVLRFVLNRPDAGNSFNGRMQRDLIDAFEQANGDPEVRAIVLTAAGTRHFCTGPDLRDPDLAPIPERRPGDAARRLREGSQRVVEAMLDCEKPIICGLNGTAAGGGANMVLAADLVIAEDHATIIELFTRRGLIPDGGAAYLLARRLPPNVAKELVLFGEPLDMGRAEQLGLVNRVVSLDDFESTLHRMVDSPRRRPHPGVRGVEAAVESGARRRPCGVVRARGDPRRADRIDRRRRRGCGCVPRTA